MFIFSIPSGHIRRHDALLTICQIFLTGCVSVNTNILIQIIVLNWIQVPLDVVSIHVAKDLRLANSVQMSQP